MLELASNIVKYSCMISCILWARVMVFNATFNNISVILWQPVLLVEQTTDLPQVTDKLSSTPRPTGFELTMLVVIGTDCINPTTIRS